MKEWDTDAYIRKWKSTYGFFRLSDKRLQYGYFKDFWPESKAVSGVLLDEISFGEAGPADTIEYDRAAFTVTPKVCKYSLEVATNSLVPIKLEYYPVDSGWYPNIHGYALLTRRHLKDFKIGLNSFTHCLSLFGRDGKNLQQNSQFHTTNFLVRPDYVQYDPRKPFGIVSPVLSWNRDQLFYLNRTIGFLVNGKWKLEHKAYIPHVAPYLGSACPIET